MGEGGQIWLKCITGDLIMMIRDKNNIFERVKNFHADLALNYPSEDLGMMVEQGEPGGQIEGQGRQCDMDGMKKNQYPSRQGGRRRGVSRSAPVAHQSGRRAVLTISGNCLGLPIKIYRVIWNFSLHLCQKSLPPSLARLD